MKKFLLTSLLLGIIFNCFSYGQMPAHPSLIQKILNKEIEMPYAMKNSHLLKQQGIDAPWKSTTNNIQRSSYRQFGPAVTPTGSYKALVILVNFSDKPSQTNAASFNDILFAKTSGTLWDYYHKISYGTFDLETVNLPGSLGWKTAPQTYSYYCNGQNGEGSYPHNARKLAEDIVNLVNPLVDFSKYDNDGDGYVDALFIIHAGPGAELTGSNNDIGSHSWTTVNPVNVDGVIVSRYSIEPEYWQNPGDITIGVFAHEFGHSGFGLPDLYDIDYTSQGLGNWSLMAGGSWDGSQASWGASGDTPAFPDAWSHIQMGFVTPVNVTNNLNNQQIENIVATPKVYKIWKNGSPGNQYFLVENRQRTGYDTYLPGDGLAIFHVDETVTTDNQNEWYPGHTSSGHYLVALEQTDGGWDLEKKLNRGDGTDLYNGSKSFNNNSVPDSKDYNSQSTGVSVKNISNSQSTMTADFEIFNSGVTVVYPNGGEVLNGGTNVNIQWNPNNITNVTIQFSSNNGSTWQLLGNVPASPASFHWTVPAISTTQGLIKISDANNTSNNDQSNSTFSIVNAANYSVSILPNTQTSSASVGQKIVVEIKIGDPVPIQLPDNFYGVSFWLNWDKPEYLEFDSYSDGGWLASNPVEVVQSFNNHIEAGLSRTSGTGVTGSGTVLFCTLKVKAVPLQNTTVTLSLTNISGQQSSGNALNLLSTGNSTINLSPGLAVWPGDADNNGTANVADVLPLGVYYNSTGTIRQNASCSWEAQNSSPWNSLAQTYADCNGDGIINTADVLCIGLNYNKNHSVIAKIADRPKNTNEDKLVSSLLYYSIYDLNDNLISINDLRNGEYFYLSVQLSNTKNILGISAGLKYNNAVEVADNWEDSGIKWGSIWGENKITLNKNNAGNEIYDIAAVETGRISLADTKNTGIARIKMKVLNEANLSFDFQDISANDQDGNSILIKGIALTKGANDNSGNLIKNYQVNNYPNPFNPVTRIQIMIPQEAIVSLVIYNMLGEKAGNLLTNEKLGSGIYNYDWDASGMPSGIYFCSLITDKYSAIKKMILLK